LSANPERPTTEQQLADQAVATLRELPDTLSAGLDTGFREVTKQLQAMEDRHAGDTRRTAEMQVQWVKAMVEVSEREAKVANILDRLDKTSAVIPPALEALSASIDHMREQNEPAYARTGRWIASNPASFMGVVLLVVVLVTGGVLWSVYGNPEQTRAINGTEAAPEPAPEPREHREGYRRSNDPGPIYDLPPEHIRRDYGINQH